MDRIHRIVRLVPRGIIRTRLLGNALQLVQLDILEVLFKDHVFLVIQLV